MLQCAAVCCSVMKLCIILHCVVLCCSVLQYVAVCCSVLGCETCSTHEPCHQCVYAYAPPHFNAPCLTATHPALLQHITTLHNIMPKLQHTSPHCNSMQLNAIHCNMLQHTTIHCSRCESKFSYSSRKFSARRRTATHRNVALQHIVIFCNTS